MSEPVHYGLHIGMETFLDGLFSLFIHLFICFSCCDTAFNEFEIHFKEEKEVRDGEFEVSIPMLSTDFQSNFALVICYRNASVSSDLIKSLFMQLLFM